MNRWLARLSMSFIIIAAVLAYTAFQTLQQHGSFWRIAIYLFAAAAAMAMGAMGTRIRHSNDFYRRDGEARNIDRHSEDDL